MSTAAKLKKRAAEYEQKKSLDKALQLYIQVLEDAGKDLDDGDVPLYNRVGDLLTRQGKVTEALGYYERAVDLYSERGYLNNAIALCNKILRQSPGRTAVYYKLGKISASKGFKSDARKNFLEYADRVQKAGALDEAFRALKEFASLFPDQDDIRLILAEQLSKENRKGEALEQLQALYQKLEHEGRSAEARATIDRMKAIDPDAVPHPSGPQGMVKPNDLVFLDLTDEGVAQRRTPATTPAGSTPRAAASPPASVPALEGLSITFIPDAEPERAGAGVGRIEGFEPTAAAGSGPAPDSDGSSQAPERTGEFEVVAEPVPVDFESRAPVGMVIETLDLETPPTVDLENPRARMTTQEQAALSGSEFAELELSEVARPTASRTHDLALPTALPMLDVAEMAGEPGASGDGGAEREGESGLAGVADGLESMDTADGLLTGAAAVDPIALERERRGDAPDQDAAAGEQALSAVFSEVVTSVVGGPPKARDADGVTGRDADDLLGAPPAFDTQEEGSHAFPPIAGLEDGSGGDTPDGVAAGTEPLPNVTGASGTASAAPRGGVLLGGVEAQLRNRVELDPQNWTLRRQLGESLLDAGNRDEGLYELELAMVGMELAGDLSGAQEVADEIIRVAPTSVRHHQKRVEYAVRAKDRQRLIEAYLELADALFRTGQGDKSVAVYARVVELAPDNDRARFALSALAPDELQQVRGAPRPGRWSQELETIAQDSARIPPTPRPGSPDAPRADSGAAATSRREPSGAGEADATPILNRATSLTPAGESDSDFVDLGEWLRMGEPAKSTRLVVEDAKPTGDEQADFEEMLRRFKRGVAENVDAEDYDAHYDLGVAYKEMGLTDEAIAEFQKALRGGSQRVRSYEALGQCFVEKSQYPIAAALLQRAVETPGTDDQQLVGVLYLLGFANEQMGRPADALRYYQRVFAVDLEFRDIINRVSAMEQLAK